MPVVARFLLIPFLVTLAPGEVFAEPVCAVSSPAYDAREVVCRLPAEKTPGRFQIRANFSGGHDDTSARIEPFLDDLPTVCDEGSKLKLFAEDGDVSLWCNVPAGDPGLKERVLKVVVRWNHAEYVDFSLVAR